MRPWHGSLFFVLLPLVVQAQDVPFNAYSVPDYALNASVNRYSWLVNRHLLVPQGRKPTATRAARQDTSPTMFRPSARSGNAVRLLAASAPAAQRQQIEQQLTAALALYRKVETRFGLPGNDVASATAAFLAGTYMAYHGIDFPDQHFKPLVEQMRGMLGKNEQFSRLGNGVRQEMYEQMASVGMLMAMAQMQLREAPDAAASAALSQTARTYLDQFLGVNADAIRLGPQGLVVR